MKIDGKYISSRVQAILNSNSDNFIDLVNLSGLDRRVHFRHSNWSGVSFRDCDLSGFDFTGADLRNCDFSGAKTEGAIFAGANLRGSNLNVRTNEKYIVADSSSLEGARGKSTTAPSDPLDLVNLPDRASTLPDVCGQKLLDVVGEAKLFIPCGFRQAAGYCRLESLRKLASYKGEAIPPKTWADSLPSTVWAKPLAVKQLRSALDEEPMGLIKVLKCMVVLQKAADDMCKLLSKPRINTYRCIKIHAALYTVRGPEGWLKYLKGNVDEKLDRLRIEVSNLGPEADPLKLVRDVQQGRHVTREIAEAIVSTFEDHRLKFEIEPIRREKPRGVKPASNAVKFMSPPLYIVEQHYQNG